MTLPPRAVLTHQPCPCGKSSDAYTIYDDGHGYCFGQCGNKFFPSKGNIIENFTYQYIPRRGISAETHQFFKAQAKVAEDGTPLEIEYPYYERGKKHRGLAEKKFWTSGDMSTPGGWGPQFFPAGSAKAITIVEGEDDAMSVVEMLGRYPVYSIRAAGFAKADARADYDYLQSFDKIILCLDDDEPGRKATSEIASILGYGKIYELRNAPYKDANDFLKAGKAQEFKSAWYNAPKFLPAGIVSSFSQIKTILDNDKARRRHPTPFSKLNSCLGGGLEMGRAYLVSGLTGIGKTEFFRAIQHGLLATEPEARLGVLHLEEPIRDTVKRLVSYDLKTNISQPEYVVTNEEVLEYYKQMVKDPERVHLIQHFGSEDPDVILDKIRFLVAACGCTYVFLDNITVLGTGRVQEDERKELDYLSTKLEMLVKELDFCLIFISHENENEGTRGSANINKVCDVWLNIKRDVKTENDALRNIQFWTLFKNRQSGTTGPAGRAIYDQDTGMLTEFTEDLPS